MITAPTSNEAPPASAHPHQSGTPAPRKPNTAPALPTAPAASRSAARRRISGNAPPASTRGRRQCRSRRGGGGSRQHSTAATSQNLRLTSGSRRENFLKVILIELDKHLKSVIHFGQMVTQLPQCGLRLQEIICIAVTLRADVVCILWLILQQLDGVPKNSRTSDQHLYRADSIADRHNQISGQLGQAIAVSIHECRINLVLHDIHNSFRPLKRFGVLIQYLPNRHHLMAEINQIGAHQGCRRHRLLMGLAFSEDPIASAHDHCRVHSRNRTYCGSNCPKSDYPLRHGSYEKTTSPFIKHDHSHERRAGAKLRGRSYRMPSATRAARYGARHEMG